MIDLKRCPADPDPLVCKPCADQSATTSGPTFKLGQNALDEFTAVASPWYDAGIEIYCRLLGHVSPTDGSIDVHTLWFDGQKGVGDSLGHSIWTKAIPKNVF